MGSVYDANVIYFGGTSIISAICEETKTAEETIKEFLEKHKCEFAGVAGAATAIAATPLALGALGFGAAGVAGGSFASAAQAAFYGGATGGVFSILQSAGVGGISNAANILIGGMGRYAGTYFCDLDIPSDPPIPEKEKPQTRPVTKPYFACDTNGGQFCYFNEIYYHFSDLRGNKNNRKDCKRILN